MCLCFNSPFLFLLGNCPLMSFSYCIVQCFCDFEGGLLNRNPVTVCFNSCLSLTFVRFIIRSLVSWAPQSWGERDCLVEQLQCSAGIHSQEPGILWASFHLRGGERCSECVVNNSPKVTYVAQKCHHLSSYPKSRVFLYTQHSLEDGMKTSGEKVGITRLAHLPTSLSLCLSFRLSVFISGDLGILSRARCWGCNCEWWRLNLGH